MLNRHELPADKALLRMRHYHDSAPEANAGNAAMHLANFALHAVAARSARLQDPRMRSLRSVGHLQVRLLPQSSACRTFRCPSTSYLIVRCHSFHAS